MRFTKMQGVGNDFVVVEMNDIRSNDLPSLARRLSERKFSIGADGLLVLDYGGPEYSFSFRMFNPDGSEDMCGNGLRCACLWAFSRGLVEVGDIKVKTKDGIKYCHLLTANSQSATVRVNMGRARLAKTDIPMIGDNDQRWINAPLFVQGKEYHATIVNTGSTHTVLFREEPVSDNEFFGISPLIENLDLFPERTSVLWVSPGSLGKLIVRIWERGAGETLGCGTGACAVGVAAVLNNRAERGATVVVSSKGGELEIQWADDVWMTGPAELVFSGTL